MRYAGVRLHSAFQPIFSLVHQRAVGFEALLRGVDPKGNQTDPVALFARAASRDQVRQLDLLCHAVHLGNARPVCVQGVWLFMNIHPRSLGYATYFDELDAHVAAGGFRPPELVLEVLESDDIEARQLEYAIAELRARGYVIALDDFGAGHSNIDRIVRLAPDIVKLDRILVQRASRYRPAQRILPTLVRLLHEAGTLVLVEGMENSTEAMIALDSGADMVQGFYFHRPFDKQSDLPRSVASIHALYAALDQARTAREAVRTARLAPCVQALHALATRWAAGATLEQACAPALVLENVARCYLLDRDGWQVGPSLRTAANSGTTRFFPLEDTAGARWASRQYFREALGRIGEPAVSQPYLSITDAYMCVTISLAARARDAVVVACLDVRWD